MREAPYELLKDRALLLAVCEMVSPSMNGKSAFTIAEALEDIALDITDTDEVALLAEATAQVDPQRVEFWRIELYDLSNDGVETIAVTDPDYPTNLGLVHNRPPLLFVRGHIDPEDQRSVAVVGTRAASTKGRNTASDIARDLVDNGVTVISGLAKGIDVAAHTAALNGGGRTIAVFGTPITRVYPAAHRGLAAGIARSGACVSQFLPTSSTGPWSFPVRNITMSALSVGTVVVEAGETSGARIQAEAAVAHGKRLFLLDQLVMHQPWAGEMADHPLTTVCRDAADVIAQVDEALDPVVGTFA